MIDPTRAVALDAAIDHVVLIDVEIKCMVGLQGVVRMAILCLLPSNELPLVLNDDFMFRDIDQSKNALAMHAGTLDLDAGSGFFGFKRGRQLEDSIQKRWYCC